MLQNLDVSQTYQIRWSSWSQGFDVN